MQNEFAKSQVDHAIIHFSEIDTSHSGKLNLVDIVRYEDQGPEQKQVGQFLERNLNTLSGISKPFKTDNTNSISLPDLEFVDKVALGVDGITDEMRFAEIKSGAWATGKKAVGFPLAMTGAMAIINPSGLKMMAASDIAGFGIGAAAGASSAARNFNNRVRAVDTMH